MIAALWSGHDDNLLSSPNVETNCKFVKFDNFVKLTNPCGISAAGNSAPRSRSVATMAFTIEAPLSDIAAASIADNSAARRS
jgi:hypothetical protein